jgi:hypothetical protein
MNPEPKERTLWHQSGVNPKGEPFIQLLLDEEIIAQMSPEMARDHARALTEAAEAAEQDAFLMDFFQKNIGLPFEEAGRILVAFREYRARSTGKSQGPTRPTGWVMPKPGDMPDYGDFTRKDPKP